MALLLRAFILIFAAISADSHAKPFLVAIDPGHGGADHGAKYTKGSQRFLEKDLALLLAKDLAHQLRLRKIHPVLTRRTDKNLTLEDRTAMANRVGADLFVSIHLNASHHHKNRKNREVRGIETYIFNNSTSEYSKRIADHENQVLKGSFAANADRSDVQLMVKELILSSNLAESKHLACLVQDEVVKKTSTGSVRKIINRGVKQALFMVLLGADMPSILFEAGFIHSKKDRNKILKAKQRTKLAAAMADAIVKYKRHRGTKRAARTLTSCQIH